MDEPVKKDAKKNEDIVAAAKERFKQGVDAESDNRGRAIEDIRFVELDEQWDKKTRTEREGKGRPCMVINKCAAVKRQVVNDARQNKPRIKVRPADKKAQLAELYNGLIRNIENESDADAAYDIGIDHAAAGGWGYWRVVTEYADDDVFEQNIRVRRITNQFSVYIDPAAKLADKSDMRWAFVVENMDRKEFERQFPKADTTGWNEEGQGEMHAGWFSESTVRVAEYYYKEPETKTLWQILTVTESGEDYDTIEAPDNAQVIEQNGNRYVLLESGPAQIMREREVKTDCVYWCKIAGNQIIEGPTKQAGKYIPVVCCIGDEAWVEGKPHYKSVFYHAKDAQRLYNWARSNAVETLALSPKQPFIGTPAMFEGHEDEWDEANSVPKMRLTANLDGGMLPQRQPLSIADTGALQEAMQSADDIKATTGLYDAAMGKEGNEKSGKAILARQRESDTATFHLPDNQARAIKYTGRILVDLIPHIYDTERVVRILGVDGSESWAEINKRIPDPMSPNGYKVINDLSAGKYDVTCDIGPGYMTKRLEASDGMFQFLTAAPNTAPVMLPRIAKNLDWPEAEEISQELQQVMQPQQPDPAMIQAQQQQAQAQMQLEQQKMQVEMAKAQMDLEGKKMDLEGKRMDIESKQMDARQNMTGAGQ
jgi:hypothetical protein